MDIKTDHEEILQIAQDLLDEHEPDCKVRAENDEDEDDFDLKERTVMNKLNAIEVRSFLETPTFGAVVSMEDVPEWAQQRIAQFRKLRSKGVSDVEARSFTAKHWPAPVRERRSEPALNADAVLRFAAGMQAKLDGEVATQDANDQAQRRRRALLEQVL
jgi:hypothetical protein